MPIATHLVRCRKQLSPFNCYIFYVTDIRRFAPQEQLEFCPFFFTLVLFPPQKKPGHGYLLSSDPIGTVASMHRRYGDLFRLDLMGNAVPAVIACSYEVS